MRVESAEKLLKGATQISSTVLTEMSRYLKALKNPGRLVEACRALLEISRIS